MSKKEKTLLLQSDEMRHTPGTTNGRTGAATHHPGQPPAEPGTIRRLREFFHFADVLSPSLLKHRLEGEGGAAEWQSRRRLGTGGGGKGGGFPFHLLQYPRCVVPMMLHVANNCSQVQERSATRSPGHKHILMLLSAKEVLYKYLLVSISIRSSACEHRCLRSIMYDQSCLIRCHNLRSIMS